MAEVWRRDEFDDVQLQVAAIVFAAARRAYDYTPADERPERIAEESAGEADND